MSVKQLFEAEKKIRILTTLQQKSLLAACSLHAKSDVPSTSAPEITDHEWLKDFLIQQRDLDSLSESDANVTCFVSGYIGEHRARRKCLLCSELLVAKPTTANMTDFVPRTQDFV